MRSRKGCFIMKQPFYIVKFNFKYIISYLLSCAPKTFCKILVVLIAGYF